jgi:hypothetical protein
MRGQEKRASARVIPELIPVEVVVQVKPFAKTLSRTEAYNCLGEMVEVGAI